jgi:uncharacterized protein (DUF927 family)
MFGNVWKMEINGNATQTGIEILAESYCDLPLFLDETGTNADDKFMTQIIYMVANGQGRARGNKDLTMRDPSSWRTVAFTTNEQPITKMESKSGELVRVISIKGGLPEGMGEEVKQAYTTIRHNYGHVAPLFINKVFENLDILYDRFSTLRKEFANTGSNTGDRMADHFAAFALAGELLEEVFSDIGMETRDSIEIVKNYFEACVREKPIELYSIRALRDVMDWIETNVKGFYSKYNSPNNKAYGWIEEACIDVTPKALKGAIRECGFSPDRVLPEWFQMGILDTTDEKRFEKVTTKNKQTKRVIRIVMECVEHHLGIESMVFTPDEATVNEIRDNVEHFCNKWNKPINSGNCDDVVSEFVKWNPSVDVETVKYVFEKVNNIC